jgi:oxygen-independent coproporphyrinogen-3 oxidase
LRALHKLGINRISLGAQTFNATHLKTLGRIHDAKQIYAAVDAARAAGFKNINLDLIFAIPGQTVEEWKEDLRQALSVNPEHISAYSLQIEEGTPLWEITTNLRLQTTDRPPHPHNLQLNSQLTTHNPQLITEDAESAMYEHTIETLLAAGYHHYEISNFAKPGFECRHNINYWKNGNYLGVGAAASSHISGNRFDNPRGIEEYLEWVKGIGYRGKEKGSKDKGQETRDKLAALLKDSKPDRSETIFMGLRLLEGLEKENFAGFEKEIKELIAQKLLKQTSRRIKLTRKGLFLANVIFERFV